MISRGIPTKEYPQWGCFEQDQAESLQKVGHKVIVVSVDSRFLLRWRSIGITHKSINGVDYYNSFWIPGSITNLFKRLILINLLIPSSLPRCPLLEDLTFAFLSSGS